MALRYDFVQTSAPRIDSKTGILRCQGTIARTGVQDYRNSDGTTRREFRPPDEVEKSAKSFETQPITLEHPPEMVNSTNSRQYMRGLSGAVTFDGELLKTDLTVTDQEAIDAAQTTHRQISNGYECDIDETPGTWKGQKYDCVQRNIRGNHVALVQKARAGDVAKLHFDSADNFPEDCAIAVRLDESDLTNPTEIPAVCVLDSLPGHTKQQIPLTTPIPTHRPRMANLRIDSVEYSDVPEALAAQMSNKLLQLAAEAARADAAEEKRDEAEAEKQDLATQLEKESELKDRERGRADNLEIQVEDLTYRLEEKPETKTDEDDADPATRLDESDILSAIATGIQQGISSRVDAYEVLVQHGVDLEGVDFTPELTPSQVQERVLELVQPGVKLDGVDDSVRHVYIMARYDALKVSTPIATEERNDAENFVADAKGAITQNRKKSMGKGMGKEELDESSQAKMDACSRPLSMSKRR